MSSPPDGCAFQSRTTERHFWHASRGGYCTVPQSRHCCSSKRPSAAAAVRPSATRLRAAGGSVGSRVRRIGFLRFGRCKDCRSASETTVVVDHSETTHKTKMRASFRAFHLPALCLAGELANALHHAEEAAGRARLADGELAA